MVPIRIEMLLHYSMYADDYRQGDLSAPDVVEAMEDFFSEDLLQRSGEFGRRFKLSERGEVYVKALQAVPLPELEKRGVMKKPEGWK
jgi:hypothetical protein